MLAYDDFTHLFGNAVEGFDWKMGGQLACEFKSNPGLRVILDNQIFQSGFVGFCHRDVSFLRMIRCP